jgi:tripartite-type tricarboxylate transporter receptor subunit TctC
MLLAATAIGALAVSAKTPGEVVTRLATEPGQSLQSAELKPRLTAEGAEPLPMTREQFTKFINTGIARWRVVACESNIQPE